MTAGIEFVADRERPPSVRARVEAIDWSGVRFLGDDGNVDRKGDKEERWDRASVHEFEGTYGDYVLSKVSKVFPELRRSVM